MAVEALDPATAPPPPLFPEPDCPVDAYRSMSSSCPNIGRNAEPQALLTATPPPPPTLVLLGRVVDAYTEDELIASWLQLQYRTQVATHRRPGPVARRVANTGTAQNTRVHELGTEADDPTVISAQHGRIHAASATDSLVARRGRVVPHGTVPTAVRVEANAAGLVRVRQSGEARGGRLAFADLRVDVGAFRWERCSRSRTLLPAAGVYELLEAPLLGGLEMGATPYDP